MVAAFQKSAGEIGFAAEPVAGAAALRPGTRCEKPKDRSSAGRERGLHGLTGAGAPS